MNPGETFLDRLGNRHGGEPTEITSHAGSVRVQVTVRDCDRLAVVCDSLTIARARSAGALARRARAMAGRVSYLEEPLAVIEVDTASRTAVLRSAPPQADGEHRLFYELALRDDRVTLQRARGGGRGTRRRTVPFTLTRGVLSRLINDLADCLTS